MSTYNVVVNEVHYLRVDVEADNSLTLAIDDPDNYATITLNSKQAKFLATFLKVNLLA